MPHAAVKTTLSFSPGFHIRLKMAAERAGTPMAQLVEEKLMPVLEEQEDRRIRQMYEALLALEGICKDLITDASTTIDEVLYGAGDERGEV